MHIARPTVYVGNKTINPVCATRPGGK